MAYNQRFFSKIKAFNGDVYQININKNNYAGSTEEIKKYALEPLEFSYNGNNNEDYIAGSEMKFKFYCVEGKASTYNELFESNYKDYQIQVLKNNVLFWQGWLQPENISKDLIGENYYINLSATDAIADLKDIEFPAVSNTQARKSILSIIQTCLMQTGINLDIEIQLNTYEKNLMLSDEQALEKTCAILERVTEVKDGLIKYKKCYTIIEELLKNFDVRLIQANGKYILTNKYELNSFKHKYQYSGTTRTSRTAFNNVIDISTNKYNSRGELSKIAPVKTLAITYQNKNIGLSKLSYASGFWNDNSTIAGFMPYFFDDYIELRFVNHLQGTEPISPYITSQQFVVENINEQDFLKVSFDFVLNGFIYDYISTVPQISLQVKKPNASTFTTVATQSLDSTYVRNIEASIPIQETGNYQVRIQVHNWKVSAVRTVTINNLKAVAFYSTGSTTVSSTTWDKLFVGSTSGSTAIKRSEDDIIYGDGLQNEDVGNFSIYKDFKYNLTSKWNRYGKTDSVNIQFIKIQNYLNNYQKFKDRIRIEFRSTQDINFNTVIKIKTKYYTFTSFQHEIVKSVYSAELQELLLTDVIVKKDITTLNAVDGQSNPNSNNIPLNSAVGNAVSAEKLKTPRTIALTGDVNASASFDGSTDISIPVTNIVNCTGKATQTIVSDIIVEGSLFVRNNVVAYAQKAGNTLTLWDAAPKASSSVYGVVKLGSNLTYNQTTGAIDATGGVYSWNDLEDIPATFPASVHTHAYSGLTGLPTLFSGSYSDLTNKPTLFSGSYVDLTNKPASFTPASHVHGNISNAGAIGSASGCIVTTSTSGVLVATQPSTLTVGNATCLNGKAATWYSTTAHTHTFASLTSKPTTLSGYGITDASLNTHTHTFASLTSKPVTLAGYAIKDAVQLTGKTSQYIEGDLLVGGNIVSYASNGGTYQTIWDAMPVASATVKGAIKVGANLSIDANGVLSSSAAGVSSWNDLLDKPDLSVYQIASKNEDWNTPTTTSFNSSLTNSPLANHSYFGFTVTHHTQPTTYNLQVAGRNEVLKFRTLENSVQGDWNTIYHSGNFDPSTKSDTTHTHTFASLTSKPTTLSGYGITDAATSTHVHYILRGTYVSGGLEAPSYFGSNTLKLQMLQGPSGWGWTDTLWMSSYGGGDVKPSGQLLISKQYNKIGFRRQDYDATAWGATQEIWHTGNLTPSNYSTTGHTHTFSSLTSKPTTLAGYGITDASLSTHTHTDLYRKSNYAITQATSPASVAPVGMRVDFIQDATGIGSNFKTLLSLAGYSNNYGVNQLAFGYNESGKARMFIRTSTDYDTNVWGSWNEFYHSGNINKSDVNFDAFRLNANYINTGIGNATGAFQLGSDSYGNGFYIYNNSTSAYALTVDKGNSNVTVHKDLRVGNASTYNGSVYVGDVNWGLTVQHTGTSNDYNVRLTYYSDTTAGSTRKAGIYDARLSKFVIYSDSVANAQIDTSLQINSNAGTASNSSFIGFGSSFGSNSYEFGYIQPKEGTNGFTLYAKQNQGFIFQQPNGQNVTISSGSITAYSNISNGGGGNRGIGYVGLVQGGGGNAGYLAIMNPSNSRVGYIGWDASNMSYVAEIGNHNFSGAIVSNSNITAYSDRTLKTNIQPVLNVLPKLQNINAYTYNRTDLNDGKQHLGLIAQEVEAAGFTQLVEKNSEGIRSLNYQNFTAVLLQAVKEQQVMISNQQTEIEEMKTEMKIMKEQLQFLMSKNNSI